jgi:hypothetical protein
VCTAGTPPWLPSQGFPLVFGEGVVWTIHVAAGRAILSSYDKVHGHLHRTADLTTELLDGASRTQETRLSLTAVGQGVAVALGNRVVVTQSGGEFLRVDLRGQALGLVATLPHTRPGIAVMLHQGAVMYWVGNESWSDELDRDISSPIGAFIPNGPLVLASGSQLVLLETDSRGVHSVVRTDCPGQRIVGVTPAANAGDFAVLSENGHMTIYRSLR